MDRYTPNTDSNMLMTLALAAAEGFKCLSMAAQGHNDTVAGAPCWYCSSTVPVFNGAALLEDRLFNRGNLRGIAQYFTTKSRPYSLLTLDGIVPGSAQMLGALGFYEYDHMPAMWLNGTSITGAGQPPASLVVAAIRQTSEMATFRAILAAVFQIPADEAELMMGEAALHIEGVQHYLGYMEGIPVATLSLVTRGPMPGIWNVATLPRYRHKGVATEMMRVALHDAASAGHESSMLLASSEGLPLYEQLGYKTLSTVRIFVPGRDTNL